LQSTRGIFRRSSRGEHRASRTASSGLYRFEIIYKVIAFIPLLNQIFYDKNKNGSVKGENRILNLLAFVSVFLMIRTIFVISLYAAILLLMMTIRVDMQ